MEYHISKLNGHAFSSTAQIAQQTVANVARTMGFQDLSVYAYNVDADTDSELEKRIDGIIAGVSHGDCVVLQFPTWLGDRFDKALYAKLRQYKDLKLIVFVHDVLPIMFKTNYYLMDELLKIYDDADAVILPSKAMALRLQLEGLTQPNIVIQEMWDQPMSFTQTQPKYAHLLQFAGDIEKFSFFKNYDLDIPTYVYSREPTYEVANNLYLEGWQSSPVLNENLAQRGGFGLVWSDDVQINDYLRVCISHKMSTYILAGLPQIVPKYLANSYVIEDHGLGYSVESLEEAVVRVKETSLEEYAKLVYRVQSYRPLLADGQFSRRVLTEAIFKACGHSKISTQSSVLKKNNTQNVGKNMLIVTASDEIELLDDLVNEMPDYHFHIAAPTLMSESLMGLGKLDNVTVYPASHAGAINDLLMKSDFYLDINYYDEVQNVVSKAIRAGLPILAFDKTAHHREWMCSDNLLESKVEVLSNRLHQIGEDVQLYNDLIFKQQQSLNGR